MPNRRQFLKVAAVVAAGQTLAVNVPRVHAAGNGIIKIGLIGSGGRGLGAANQALATGKDVKLVAVGDYFKDRAANGTNALKKQFSEQVDVPADKIFDGFKNAQGVIASGADVILIACAAKFHPIYSLLALQAGKHVFCEKPNAIDANGLQTLTEAVKLAKEKNLCFLSGLMSRFAPQYQQLFAKIQDGAIGDIKSIHSNYLRAPYGVRGYPQGMSELDVQVYNQYMFSWLSGDDFTQSLVHNVDRMTWVLGGQVPSHAFGMGGRSSMTDRQFGNVFDHHAAAFVYPGDAFHFQAYCRTTTGCYNNEVDTIIGTKGTAYVGQAKITGENPWHFEGQKLGGHAEEQVALFNAIRKGERLHSDDYIVKSTQLAILGQVAAYTGRVVGWDEMYNSNFAFKPLPEECFADAPVQPPIVPDPKTGSYPVPIPGQVKFW
ncbi:MAG: Gfo/Idh/MocA family oxidoreductase [Planctomycetaceae bacterium]|nr:Gfo/Idh/MocA family oxidoreductase [Planctomycetaceae bacterium]